MSEAKRLRICHIAAKGMSLGGGIEKYIEEIGSRMAAKGHRVLVYAMKHYGAKNGMYKGMEIRTIPTVKTRSFEKIIASLFATVRQTVARDCDLVHCHAFGPAMFSWMPRLTGQAVVTQGHGLEWKRSRWHVGGKLFLRLTEYPSVKGPHGVTVVSRTLQHYLQEKYGVSSVYIPTGINPPQHESDEHLREFGLTSGSYILFLSRLVREKGAHHLIAAFNKLRTDAKLVIAGDAQHEEQYKRELKDLAENNPNVLFPGFVSGARLRALFGHARLFVLPSEIEGMSIALLEAMSYANCCLVSDIPENREAIQGHGYTFQNENVEDLADRLQWLLANPDAADNMGKEGQNYVLENHLWDSITARMEDFYRQVLSRR